MGWEWMRSVGVGWGVDEVCRGMEFDWVGWVIVEVVMRYEMLEKLK